MDGMADTGNLAFGCLVGFDAFFGVVAQFFVGIAVLLGQRIAQKAGGMLNHP